MRPGPAAASDSPVRLDVRRDPFDPGVEPAASRASKSGDGSHRSAVAGDRPAHAGSSDHALAVRRPASAAWSRASATMSSVVAARTTATGAGAGRNSSAITPRTRPIPSEKNRVIWSAPTNSCQWRSVSSRRNVPRLDLVADAASARRTRGRPCAAAPRRRSPRAPRRPRSGRGCRRGPTAPRPAPGPRARAARPGRRATRRSVIERRDRVAAQPVAVGSQRAFRHARPSSRGGSIRRRPRQVVQAVRRR